MTRFLVIGGLVVAIAAVAIIGCGPRAKVAGQKIMDKIDAALGELDIKRQSIADKMKEVQGQMDQVKKGLYSTEARLEVLGRKKTKSEEVITDIKSKLIEMDKLVNEVNESEDKSIVRNDKTYTAQEVDNAAKQIIKDFELEQTKLGGLNTAYEALKDSVSFLKDQKEKSTALMTELEQKLAVIDSKQDALDTVRKNTILAGNNDSISESLAKLSEEIEELEIGVTADWNIQKDKMDEISNKSTDIDDMLSTPDNLESTSAKIQELLNK